MSFRLFIIIKFSKLLGKNLQFVSINMDIINKQMQLLHLTYNFTFKMNY